MEQDIFKIFVVDDQRMNLEILSRILQPDYKISTARSGEEALKKLQEEDLPDLILLDIIMPGMSGFDVLAALKESEHTKPIPVIIITGLETVEDEEKGFILGAVDYITKPFNKSLVKARIMTHLRIVKQMHMIEQLGLIDTLTNIPNRRSLDNKIATEWRHAARDKKTLSFIMTDVDHFKNFNDTYGHQQGDIVLETVAKTIKSSVNDPHALVARYGGEEFGIVLPETELPKALEVAENIRANIEKTGIPQLNDTALLNVTISLGVASMMPTFEDSMTAFIEKADKAMYNAKESGRNKVCS